MKRFRRSGFYDDVTLLEIMTNPKTVFRGKMEIINFEDDLTNKHLKLTKVTMMQR